MQTHKHPQLENSYHKTISVIESCKTENQLEGASRMVENFKTMYKNVGYPRALSYNLDRKLDKQRNICQ
jgi:predicted translin family RNA/ssDNA-binding protein